MLLRATFGSVLALLGPAAGSPGDEQSEPTSSEIPSGEVPSGEGLTSEGLTSEDEDLDDQDTVEVVVDASVLGDANAFDVFTLAGGRTVVGQEQARERGATSVGEAIQRAPGVRTVEG